MNGVRPTSFHNRRHSNDLIFQFGTHKTVQKANELRQCRLLAKQLKIVVYSAPYPLLWIHYSLLCKSLCTRLGYFLNLYAIRRSDTKAIFAVDADCRYLSAPYKTFEISLSICYSIRDEPCR